MNTLRLSVTLYGTSVVGFTYLLGIDGAGLAATSGRGSDYGVKNADRGEPCQTMGEAIDAAMQFVPEGAAVCVHAPGTGAVIRRGTKRGSALVG